MAENTSTATAIKLADIVVTDDALGTNTLSLTGTDAAFFEIVGTALRLKAGTVLNFEAKSSYSVTVQVDDTTVGATPDATTNFTLTITDVNEAPTAVALQNTTTSLAENTSTVSAIKLADIVVTDDALGTNTLSLTGTDAAFFEIVGTELRLKAGTVLNFEAKSSYSVTINVDDTTVGATPDLTTNFTLTITNVNEAPTAIALTNTSIDELKPAGTAIGQFSTVDEDAGDSFTYTLVAGAGADDNGSFTIIGNELRSSVQFVFSTKSSYSIRVRSTDSGNLTTERTFTITINDKNNAPTNITLSAARVTELLPAGTFVGTISSDDPDGPGVTTYSVVNSSSAPFEVRNGNQLFTTRSIDVFQTPVQDVTIRATDAAGDSTDATIRLTVDQVIRAFRAYNIGLDAHFFTTNRDEFDIAVAAGYRDEATGNPGFAILVGGDAPAAQALYRLYNLATGRHYYTMSLGEARDLEAVYPPPASGPDTRRNGWRFEGVVGYMFETPVPGSIEIFRLYNSFNGGHLFTTEPAERDFALGIVDQATQVRPWSQHRSLGFAYFSDPIQGTGRRGLAASSNATATPTVSAATAADNSSAPVAVSPSTNVASLIATGRSATPPAAVSATAQAVPDSGAIATRTPLSNSVFGTAVDNLFADLDGLETSLLAASFAR